MQRGVGHPAAVPSPEIEPAALPLPPVIAPAPTEPHDALIIVGPAVEASAAPAPAVERLIL